MKQNSDGKVGKRIEFDGETWHAVHRLSLDMVKSLRNFPTKPSETC